MNNIRQLVFFQIPIFLALIACSNSTEVLVEGDMLVEESFAVPFMNQLNVKYPSNTNQIESKSRAKRAVTSKQEHRWPYGVVPYVIDASVGFSGTTKVVIKEAMQEWEKYTCIKFVERDPNNPDHTNYINLTKLPCGCCAHVGRQGNGGQHVSLGKGCHKKGVIVHELGHAIGFVHEQQRPDRDEYVDIYMKNILPGQDHNFDKRTSNEVDSLGEEYGYDSIMHYSKDVFSKHSYSGKILTIQPKHLKNGLRPEIGQRERLSPGDIRQTNKMYKCAECGETFIGERASFTSPNYRGKDGSRDKFECEWRIQATDGEHIQLNIIDLDIFTSNDCQTDYLEIYDGYWHKSPLLQRFCGNNTRIPTIFSTASRLLIKYVSTHSEHRGFAASYEAICGGNITIDNTTNSNGLRIKSPNHPQLYLPNKKCIWIVTVPEGNQVELEFESFDLEMQTNCRNDFIEVGVGKKSKRNKYCGHSLPPVLKSASNKMYIRFVSDGMNERKGFSAILYRKSDGCALMKEHGCEQDCINERDGYRCACRLGYKLRSDQKTCEVTCGGLIEVSEGSGIIESPFFPAPYPANEKCDWEIVTRDPNRITLNFMHFELEGSNVIQENCDYDSVTISSIHPNGTMQQKKFCSGILPPAVTSITNIMRIAFRSDKGVQKSGFSAIYSTTIDRCAVSNGGCEQICHNTNNSFTCSCKSGFVLHENGLNCESKCRYEITAPQGVINSPNYPRNYPKNTDCIWHFKAIHGHRPMLEFVEFELEGDYYDCTDDYVTVYIPVDPSNPHISGSIWTLLWNTCGAKKPEPITSKSDDLYMTFKTNESVQRKGFSIKHSTVCGGHFEANDTAKYIYSHARFGDTFYDNNTDCEWDIMDRDRRPIHLKFLEFDVEIEESCKFDWVEIYEYRSNQRWAKYGRFCESNLNLEIVAFRRLKIRFRTDDAVNRKGFSFSYAVANRKIIQEFKSGAPRFTRLGDVEEEELEIL